MKKATAIILASLFVAPAVMADATIYGSIRAVVQYDRIDTPTGKGELSNARLADDNSRLGFKGSSKLDNGLDLSWILENRVRVGSSNIDGTNNSSVGWVNRFAMLALKGDFGQVKAGRFDDIIDDTAGDFYMGVANIEETSGTQFLEIRRLNARANNLIAYTSPSMNGFGVKAQYDFGAKNAATGTNTNAYATTAYYNSKTFDIGAGYKHVNDTLAGTGVNLTATATADGDAVNYYIAGANLKPIDGLNIGFAWDHSEKSFASGATTIKQNGFALGALYTVGKLQVGLAAGLLKDTKGAALDADTGSKSINLGYKYMLGKQISVIGGVSYVKNDANLVAGSNTVSNSVAGAKISSISTGIRTDF